MGNVFYPSLPVLDVVAAVIVDGDRYLACRRGPGRDAAGQWEFPGGKVEPGESAAEALIREIHEELGVSIGVGPMLTSSQTTKSDRIIDIRFYFAHVTDQLPTHSNAHDRLDWLTSDKLAALDWAVPDLAAVGQLSSGRTLTLATTV